MIRSALLLVALCGALSACGNRAALEPKQGRSLPVAPYGREEPRPASALLKPSVQTAPERTVELRKRSEERADDPFDLPPSD